MDKETEERYFSEWDSVGDVRRNDDYGYGD